MRGRLRAGDSKEQKDGNTPAYAGKTVHHRQRLLLPEKHPRVCGEDGNFSVRSRLRLETPPRMRGRPPLYFFQFRKTRNTPAYAGKTRPGDERRAPGWKHPRVCGEDTIKFSSFRSSAETPPRMRGRPPDDSEYTGYPRNTPAYAGKTTSPRSRQARARKHPRVCGEDSPTASQVNPLLETPPRMRGRLIRSPSDGGNYRNTPAYAGKTTSASAWRRQSRKHPRVCGED